jgi:FkbM family methyltransferase
LSYKRLRKQNVLSNAKAIGFSPGAIVDVGFAYGTEGLYEVFEDARYVLIDPMQEVEEVMQRFCEGRPGSVYFVAAASDHEGEMEFIAREGVTGSSFHTKLKADGVKRKVPLVTLDRILAENDLPDPLLIKLDTEGHEMHVLRGAEKALERAGMVIIEISTWMEENSLGRPSMMEIFNFMDQRGFVFYEFAEPAFRPVDGALYMFDAVFVPKDSPLRRHRGSKTPEQARIASAVKRQHAQIGILPRPPKPPRNLWERLFGRRG